MLAIAQCVVNDTKLSRRAQAETLLQLSQVSAAAADAAHAITFHTLMACVSHAEHFFAIPDISKDLPTRTVLLAATLPLDTRYPAAVNALRALQSLSIVCCSPGEPQDIVPPDDGGETLFSLVSQLVHRAGLARMSLALRSSMAMNLSSLDLSGYASLTQLRLILQSPDLHISASFTLPQSLTHLVVSPAVLLKVSCVVLSRLTHFSLCEPDGCLLMWPGNRGYTIPLARYTSPVPMGSALHTFLSSNPSIASVMMDDIAVTGQMLQTLLLLPSLSALSLHPASWHVASIDTNVLRRTTPRYSEDDALCVFAETVLPALSNLCFLHVGGTVQPRLTNASAVLAWGALLSLAPPSLLALARGYCQSSRHMELRGTCSRPQDVFTWASDELKSMTFRLYD